MAGVLSYNRVTYPIQNTPDLRSPLRFFKSMKLISDDAVSDTTRGMDPLEILTVLHDEGQPSVLAEVWSEAGGADITSLNLPIVIDLGEKRVVDGPEKMGDLEHSPVTFVQIDIKGKARAAAAIAIDRVSRVIDVCVFDPACVLSPDNLRNVSKYLVDWLRRSAGDGWAIRSEEYSECMCPHELSKDDKSAQFWYLMMVLLKSYLPHVRLMDHQAAMRSEAFAAGMSLKDVVLLVARRVYTILTAHKDA